MDDIAEDLGISKKTIYKWFADKDQLVTESLTTFLEEIKHICTETTANAIDEFCSTINTAIQKLLNLDEAFFYDLKKYHHQAYLIWQEYKQEHIIQLLQANFWRGIQSGLYRPDVNSKVTARLYLGQLQIIYNSELFPLSEFDRQDIYQLNLKHFLLGLVSSDGIIVLNQVKLKYCHL